ncbi:MAG: RT0821/Lpp0805 family surface protein [Hyphomicrobiales bacterium]
MISLVVLCSAISLAGCSITGFGPEVDEVSTTASVRSVDTTASLQDTVDPSDWDKVREVMSTVLVSQPAGKTLPWENTVTGTIGTIVPMGLVSGDNGTICRKFSTTINGIGGILQYRGDACKPHNGPLELKDLEPHNAVVDATVDALPKLQ